jgi:hypothetical protein
MEYGEREYRRSCATQVENKWISVVRARDGVAHIGGRERGFGFEEEFTDNRIFKDQWEFVEDGRNTNRNSPFSQRPSDSR